MDQNYPEIFRVDYAAGGPQSFSKLEDGGALIGKQLAEGRELGVGSKIEIPGPKGRKKYPVDGVIGVFAGLLPARSAARKSIVEAVQYE